MERIAIFGGSFNPVHNQHIALAKSVVAELNLDRLIIMPTYTAPHKTDAPAPAEHRLNMLKIAFANEERIEVSDYEISKGGTSYTYLTVEHFKQTTGAEIFFLVGADMLKDFKTWRYPERILNACTLCAFDRTGEYTDYAKEQAYFQKTFGKSFLMLKGVGEERSSTQIRVYNQLGLDITDKTDIGVAEYIKANGVYEGDKYAQFIKKSLPLKRLVHTANVTVCALYKAKELGLDKQKVQVAAMLHDWAKYMDHTLIGGFELPVDVPAPVVHAFLGAYVAQTTLGITDNEVLDAIRYHTSGRANMSTLEKLIFVADMVEDGRTYEGVDKLRKLYYTDDFDKCFKECLAEELKHLLAKKQYVYKETLNASEYYLKDYKGDNQ